MSTKLCETCGADNRQLTARPVMAMHSAAICPVCVVEFARAKVTRCVTRIDEILPLVSSIEEVE